MRTVTPLINVVVLKTGLKTNFWGSCLGIECFLTLSCLGLGRSRLQIFNRDQSRPDLWDHHEVTVGFSGIPQELSVIDKHECVGIEGEL